MKNQREKLKIRATPRTKIRYLYRPVFCIHFLRKTRIAPNLVRDLLIFNIFPPYLPTTHQFLFFFFALCCSMFQLQLLNSNRTETYLL